MRGENWTDEISILKDREKLVVPRSHRRKKRNVEISIRGENWSEKLQTFLNCQLGMTKSLRFASLSKKRV